jgi:hypothetical protein
MSQWCRKSKQHTKRHVLGHGDGDCLGERRGLGERVEVAQSKGQRHSLLQVDNNLTNELQQNPSKTCLVTLLVGAGGGFEGDVSLAQLARCREVDAVLGHGNDNWAMRKELTHTDSNLNHQSG